ncbi:MAG: MurR/RpiR family transcriptional regulator, partial [Rhodobacteraceae bacterium]|nr:MurR/RpiR family transcriptional regulator [Paracoccaceae bacterium]
MSVTETIRSLAATFTPSERKLVDCLIVRPQQAALGTASEFARQVGVHEATASRLARKLGFESYASFRRAVQAQFLPTQEPATRIDASLRAASGSDILEILVRQEVEALAAIPQQIDAATLDAAAQEMVQAGRLFFFAQGNAELLALMMTKRFRRFGCDAAQLSADPRALAEQLLGLRQGDLVVAFVFRRAPRVYAPMMQAAQEAGARTMVIAGGVGPLLSPAADRLITAPRSGSPEGFQ